MVFVLDMFVEISVIYRVNRKMHTVGQEKNREEI